MAPLQLLGQMLPLIVFIIVDAVFNNVKASIISAIVFAAVQLLFFYQKTGKFDWFVLVDVVLIASLGAVSILLKNDIFFKIKPAIIEAATIIFFVVLIILPDQFLLNYFGRMMPSGAGLQPSAIKPMKMMLIGMCGYILLHIGAVLFTAFHSSRRVWAFVSGPGFYLLFIPVIPVVIVRFIKNQRAVNRH